jgi:hypothetical protein
MKIYSFVNVQSALDSLMLLLREEVFFFVIRKIYKPHEIQEVSLSLSKEKCVTRAQDSFTLIIKNDENKKSQFTRVSPSLLMLTLLFFF